jgi:hypothetical protein
MKKTILSLPLVLFTLINTNIASAYSWNPLSTFSTLNGWDAFNGGGLYPWIGEGEEKH